MADSSRRILHGLQTALLVVFFLLAAVTGTVSSGMNRSAFAGDVKVIVIDPGHGGHDHGVTGPGGIVEKQVMLTLARSIGGKLPPSFKVHLTRTGDYHIDIKYRTSVANNRGADLFVSLHAGGSHSSAVSVWTIYHDRPKAFPIYDQKRAQAPFPWDQLQQRHIQSSARLAERIGERLEKGAAGQAVDVMGAPLPVLSGANMPAVLIETGCLTHPPTARKFANTDYINAVAGDIASGIVDFFEK